MQGVGTEAVENCKVAAEVFPEFKAGNFNETIADKLQPLINNMSKDIIKQRQRLGCNMAVAQAIYSRKQREALFKIIGADLIFIVLNLTTDCIKKRLEERHGGTVNDTIMSMLLKIAAMCEPAGADEKNAYNVYITEDMTPDDVIEKIQEIVNQKPPWKNGIWHSDGFSSFVNVVEGQKAAVKSHVFFEYPDIDPFSPGSWHYGDFGPADSQITSATGKLNYNVLMDYFWQQKGVVNEDGTQIHTIGFSNQMEIIKLLNEDELEKLKEDREPADCPSIPYFKPQPENLGKLIWISGEVYHNFKQIHNIFSNPF